jgi:hypothetical protein
MTAERLLALEPGFLCYAARGGTNANLRFFHLRLALSLFFALFLASGSHVQNKNI